MKIKRIFRVCALLLAIVLVIPNHVLASRPELSEVKASHYLASYGGYIYAAGGGKIQVWFDVTGVDEMNDIGALSIEIYESTDNKNWKWVESFTNKETPNLLGHNDDFYGGHVDYQGKAGRYYKAYICVWAGYDNTRGDRRYFWTYPRCAT